MKEETFVLIAGGGPVGLTAAIALGRQGVPAILVNERLETATHPKCNSTNARSMEHFRRLGVAPDIQRAALPPDVAREYAYVTRFCGYEFARMGRPSPYMEKGKLVGGTPDFLRSPEPPQYIPQTRIEPVLKRHAEHQSSVSVRFGWRLASFMQDDHGVTAVIEDVTTQERGEVRARYLIGADGARSLVRRELGIELAGEDGTVERAFMTGTMLSLHIRAPNLVKESGRPPALINWITNHEARGFMFAQDAHEHWIVHYQVPRGVDWRAVDQRGIVRAMLGRDTDFEIVSGGPWTGGLALIAERYGKDRAFLVGDAAHLYTPLGALGMNTGIGDAINLCWKLAAVHAGWAGEALLDSFETERLPIGHRNSKHGVRCAQKQSAWPIPPDVEADTPEAEAGRKALGAHCLEDDREQYNTPDIQLGEIYERSPIIVGDYGPPPEDTWYSYTPQDRAGARAPHVTLPDGRSLYATLGPDFTLVAFQGGDPAPLVAAARRRKVPLTIVAFDGSPPAPYRHAFILIRPDHHIAWHGDAIPQDAVALIDQVRGARPKLARDPGEGLLQQAVER